MRNRFLGLLALVCLSGCDSEPAPPSVSANSKAAIASPIVGTQEPFASAPVYFVLTDRFVNGDIANDQREQGGDQHTWDRPVPNAPAGQSANVGYLGGDFKGVLDHAGYIRDLGFGAVWITPIVDNPDEAFAGGDPVAWGGSFTDGGKTGFHGYWASNFYRLDEHLPSADVDFAQFTAGMHAQQLKVVLDVVANHGSPAYSMPTQQPKFGQLFDATGMLIADHQNLAPEQLDPSGNPLHRFFKQERDLAQLSNLDDQSPEVLAHLLGAYTQWLDQGADALRIDTIGQMPNAFWKQFTAGLRAHRPGLFLFGERFDFDPAVVASNTLPEGGAMSMLDFPLRQALIDVFENPGSDYARIEPALFLKDGPYANPYELMTFYDNHDMKRINTSDQGFIDVHNFLFTARGIPVIYYGSEIGFMRGTGEHAGNRNYFGVDGIAAAQDHPIASALRRIAGVRRDNIALQRGVQININFIGDTAAFYRIYDDGTQAQTALVLLNKGDTPATFTVDQLSQAGIWRSTLGGEPIPLAEGNKFVAKVGAHDVAVYLRDGPITAPALLRALQ